MTTTRAALPRRSPGAITGPGTYLMSSHISATSTTSATSRNDVSMARSLKNLPENRLA